MKNDIGEKKTLVTGGAGFIGTNLVNELRSRGHKVIACDLYNTEREDYIRCDVRSYRQIEEVFNQYGPFDYVYHLAAEYYDPWQPESFLEKLLLLRSDINVRKRLIN